MSNTPTMTSSSSQQLSETTALHLPDDCWESICTFLINGDDNHSYLEPLSLVSKHFLSITNRRKSSLTISDKTLPFIVTLFRRFPNLTSLHITTNIQDYFQYRLNRFCQISQFPSNLKSLKLSHQSNFPEEGLKALSIKLKTLTSLTCSYYHVSIDNNHRVLVTDCFPLLEELHLEQLDQFCFSGLKPMLTLTTLPKLRKINLSNSGYFNEYYSLLVNLFKNCEFLEEFVMLNCPTLTHDVIASAIRERPSLTSLSVSLSLGNYDDFISSLVSLKGLTCLDLSFSFISDELLTSIAMGVLPLRRLILQNCGGYSYAGIFYLLSKCHSIQHLDLKKNYFLNDQHVVELSSFIYNLVSINLSECKMLTKLALFALIKKCPLLSEIKMEKIGSEGVDDSDSLVADFGVRPQLKSLHLAYNSWLKDENINTFAFIFPNLQLLDLKSCTDISEEGISEVLRRCCKIRHLNLSGLKSLRINFKVLTLEVLNLSKSRIDDRSLYMISKSCFGLQQLDLAFCYDVTKKGVMEVVENCTQLREIDLRGCSKVAADVVDSMVFIRPSLRKIIPPVIVCRPVNERLKLSNGFL